MKLTKMHGIAITPSKINWCWSFELANVFMVFQIVKFEDNSLFDCGGFFEKCCGVLDVTLTLLKVDFHFELYC